MVRANCASAKFLLVHYANCTTTTAQQQQYDGCWVVLCDRRSESAVPHAKEKSFLRKYFKTWFLESDSGGIPYMVSKPLPKFLYPRQSPAGASGLSQEGRYVLVYIVQDIYLLMIRNMAIRNTG